MQQSIRVYRVFDDRVAVLSESDALGEHVHCYMKTLAFTAHPPPDATVRIALFQAPGNRVLLCCPELGFAANRALGRPAWVAFRQLFMRLAFGEADNRYAIHASCVADEDGRATLLVGCRNAGKTSLLATLLQQGYLLVCDDYAFIHLDEGCVTALPVGVTITEKTCELVPELTSLKSDNCKFHCEDQWQWTINLADLYTAAEPFSTFPLKHVFFIQPDFGGQSRLAECQSEQALWLLLESRFTCPPFVQPLSEYPPRYRERSYVLAQRLSRQCRFYFLTNGEIDQTAREIRCVLRSLRK